MARERTMYDISSCEYSLCTGEDRLFCFFGVFSFPVRFNSFCLKIIWSLKILENLPVDIWAMFFLHFFPTWER